MIIWNIVKAIVLLGIFPLLLGSNFLKLFQGKVSVKKKYAYGWFIMLAIFEITVIPTVFLKCSLTELAWVYTISTVVILVSIIVARYCQRKKVNKNSVIETKRKVDVYLILGICLVLIQIIIATFFIHMDTDDAYYIGTATTSLNTDTLFLLEPDTGYPNSFFPLRYVFSAIMIFWAYVSKITGIHPLIVTHTIIPGIFIAISYILWWEIGKILFKEKEKQGIFLVLISVINIFGNTSVYTQASFLLFRIWQGKAMLPNIILPAILLTFLEIYQYPKRKRQWFILFIIICAACCCSSMAVPLGMIVVVSGSCVVALMRRNWKLLLYGALCCIPCLMIGVSYLVLQ